MLAADTMEALGIPRGSYVVKVNNRKILDGLLNAADLGGEENAGKRLIVLRAIDKLDRLGKDAVFFLLTTGRKDESGDFTKGAGLNPNEAKLILEFVAPMAPTENVSSGSESDILFTMPNNWDRLATDEKFKEGGKELLEIKKLIEQTGYASDRIKIDQTVVRGLEYYTGPVYEVELTFEIKDDKGRPVRFGSVGGGGRYDGLVSRFRGEPVPATGFSIGVSRLQAALTALGKLDDKPAPGPVVVTVFDRDRTADYQHFVSLLRDAGIRAELYLGNPKNNLGSQLKYADKRAAPCAIIQGSDEKANKKVQIKDLILGANLTTIKDRDEYLRKQTESQFLVDEEQLVAEVRKLLARHGLA
jgi:histidyl-tRNA synthetase